MSLSELSFLETRVIGCLIEKSLTTPEQYPLSLNSLTTACNQKSNREPVLDLTEAQVQDVASDLVKAGLVNEQTGFGSRVVKYKHRFCNTEFSEIKMSEQELGITCVLFLRGPQTPGELRTRTNRLCTFQSLEQVEAVLEQMSAKAWVLKLPREPGKREARYAHLFSGEVHDLEPEAAASPAASNKVALGQDDTIVERLLALEEQVANLAARVEELESLLN